MNTEFYDEDYYSSHYTQLLESDRYYSLLSKYWKKVIFDHNGLDPSQTVLDYGCGLGQVSAALPNVTYFDYSSVAQNYLRSKKKRLVGRVEDIPERSFDMILSSHSLEHSPQPESDLKNFFRYLKPNGKLILVLPIEINYEPTLRSDENWHFYCWTFQTITNLLLHTNFVPVKQGIIYGPFLLNTLGKKLQAHLAVSGAVMLGKIRRHYRSMLIIAEAPPDLQKGAS